METIKDILKAKGSDVYTVKGDATVFDALSLMSEKNAGAVLVVNDAGGILGIFSERDYARKALTTMDGGNCPRDLPVKDLMSSEVITIRPDTGTETCMALMTKKRVRHLPVTEDDKLVGMISIGDVVKDLINEKDFLIAKMEQYIWDN
jgi:CBS domain-containing protein